jgi:hypothetical protein
LQNRKQNKHPGPFCGPKKWSGNSSQRAELILSKELSLYPSTGLKNQKAYWGKTVQDSADAGQLVSIHLKRS